jgi:hypothetical protein
VWILSLKALLTYSYFVMVLEYSQGRFPIRRLRDSVMGVCGIVLSVTVDSPFGVLNGLAVDLVLVILATTLSRRMQELELKKRFYDSWLTNVR